MPLAMEKGLKRGAIKHGFKPGSKRYNAYVYGHMQNIGVLNSNHAGSLGPDKMFNIKKLDYKPTFANVKGVHIAVIVVVAYLLYRHFTGFDIFAHPNPGVNGDGATQYVNTQSYGGWVATQYNSLGANAGALNGESN